MNKIRKANSSVGLLAFFENSTRTRSSFETAGLEIGIRWAYFEAEASSLHKAESLRDNFRLFASYPIHFSVVRHSQAGLCHWVSTWTNKPVINAGEGAYEHPTQAMGDAFALFQAYKSKTLKISFYGDVVNSRVARSSIRLFKELGHRVSVTRDGSKDTEIFARAFDIALITSKDLKKSDIVYALRTQKERGGTRRLDPLKRSDLSARTKIMHAGPVIWGEDIETELAIDEDRLLIDHQVNACYLVRRKLLSDLAERLST